MRTWIVWTLTWLLRLVTLCLLRALRVSSPESHLLYVHTPSRRDSLIAVSKDSSSTTLLLQDLPLMNMGGPSTWLFRRSTPSTTSEQPGNPGAEDGASPMLFTSSYLAQLLKLDGSDRN